MNKLQEWAMTDDNGNISRRGSGRVANLALYLGVTQPAVTKMIDGTVLIKAKYAKKMMEFTGLTAYDLFPEWAEIFNYSQDNQKSINENQGKKLADLKKKLQEIIDNMEPI